MWPSLKCLQRIVCETQRNVHHCRFISVTGQNYPTSKSKRSYRNEKSFVSHDQILEKCRSEAHRTVLVQTPKRQLDDLLALCGKFGEIKAVFPYRLKEDKEYALIEYSNVNSVTKLLESASHFSNEQKIPVKSRFLYFAKNKFSQPRGSQSSKNVIHDFVNRDPRNFTFMLQNSESVAAQMDVLTKTLQLTELGTRIRFFIASSLEDSMRGMFSDCIVRPFGSSMNGLGRYDCDLDMVLEMEGSKHAKNTTGLFFLSKSNFGDGRKMIQNSLETIGGILQQFMPQFYGVKRILRARVPIVKFRYVGAEVECDLCMSNKSAVYMSELFHNYCNLDHRVRPLMFTVRHWAKANDITHSIPGSWFSNFQLSVLVLFYLQAIDKPLIPTLKRLEHLADSSDVRPMNGNTLNGNTCNFIKDWSIISPSKNPSDMGKLLLGFFEFYSNFDFDTNMITLYEGKDFFVKTAEEAVVHIENPLERELNASKNLSIEELDKFQTACHGAHKSLERNFSSKRETNKSWGLLSILSADNAEKAKQINVQMKGLFNTDPMHGEIRSASQPFFNSNPTEGNDKDIEGNDKDIVDPKFT